MELFKCILSLTLIFNVINCSIHDPVFKCNSFSISRSRKYQAHPIMMSTTGLYRECCGLCTAVTECSSFNYDLVTGECSLFPDTAPEDLLLASSTTIYGESNGQNQGDNCSSRPCRNDQVCISTTSGNGYICLLGTSCDEALLPPHPNTIAELTSSTLIESLALYTCLPGYEPETGSGESICNGNNLWTTHTLDCEGVDCGPPPTFDNKSVTFVTSSLYPANIEYTCDPGYNRTEGNGTSSCQTDASWSTPSLVCEAVDCGSPPSLDHKGVTSVTSSLYPAQVEYTCDPGYNRTEGSGTSSCQTDASWSTPSLVCEAVDCGDPPSLDHQSVTSVTPSLYPAKVEYTCDPGYNRTEGNGTSSCQTDASWSTPSLMCEAVDCGEPLAVSPSSNMIFDATIFESTVQVSCAERSKFFGSSDTGYCSEDGVWTGISGSCEPDRVYIGDWVLAFRITAEIRQSAYDTWHNNSFPNDDFPVDPHVIKTECVTAQTVPPCDIHFRSQVLSTWDTAGIQWVKIWLLKDNQVRREILFRGTGMSKTNWFKAQNIVNSSWSQVNPSTKFDSFRLKSGNFRLFEIAEIYNNCQDYTWLVVTDGIVTHGCNFDIQSTYPVIMYNMRETKSIISEFAGFEYGDAMMILVKCETTNCDPADQTLL